MGWDTTVAGRSRGANVVGYGDAGAGSAAADYRVASAEYWGVAVSATTVSTVTAAVSGLPAAESATTIPFATIPATPRCSPYSTAADSTTTDVFLFAAAGGDADGKHEWACGRYDADAKHAASGSCEWDGQPTGNGIRSRAGARSNGEAGAYRISDQLDVSTSSSRLCFDLSRAASSETVSLPFVSSSA